MGSMSYHSESRTTDAITGIGYGATPDRSRPLNASNTPLSGTTPLGPRHSNNGGRKQHQHQHQQQQQQQQQQLDTPNSNNPFATPNKGAAAAATREGPASSSSQKQTSRQHQHHHASGSTRVGEGKEENESSAAAAVAVAVAASSTTSQRSTIMLHDPNVYDAKPWSRSMEVRSNEVEFMLRKPVESDEDIQYTLAAAEAGLIFMDALEAKSKKLGVLRGTLSRWILP